MDPCDGGLLGEGSVQDDSAMDSRPGVQITYLGVSAEICR